MEPVTGRRLAAGRCNGDAAIPSIGLVLAAAVLVVAQAPDQLPDVDRFGPQVGEAVPDFELVDQTGRVRTLGSILGPNGALLVFSRSAVW